jgi:hypothetical protein
MRYPEWAPKALVQLHRERPSKEHSERRFQTRDPERILGYLREANPNGFTAEELETHRLRLTRWSLKRGLPDTERTELLGKLLTNPNMKGVWAALAKRAANETAPWEFYLACEMGIAGWRGDQKQTQTERQAFYQEISESAENLRSLLRQSPEFDSYSIDDLITESLSSWLDDPDVIWVSEAHRTAHVEQLAARRSTEHGDGIHKESIPSVHAVLSDVSEKAKQYSNKEPKVKKPNSKNAEIHYFIRTLSEYCRHTYNQPLHDIVATTTAVVFPRKDIDVDYVRKLVNG